MLLTAVFEKERVQMIASNTARGPNRRRAAICGFKWSQRVYSFLETIWRKVSPGPVRTLVGQWRILEINMLLSHYFPAFTMAMVAMQ